MSLFLLTYNSFSADTLVMTARGLRPISELIEGDLVLAWDEATGKQGYFVVTDTISHVDPQIVLLTLDGDPSSGSGTETLETTAEHPFYVVEGNQWLPLTVNGRWVEVGELQVGDDVLQADGTTGEVRSVRVVMVTQQMYNVTVDQAHTFFVGRGQWLVHNCGGIGKAGDFILSHGLSGDSATKSIIKLADEMKVNGFGNLDPIKIIEHNGQKIVVDGHHRLAAARLAKVDVPYEVVDEAWIITNTGWKSVDEVVQSAGQANGIRLNQHMVKKAGYK
ncbi:MAG: polymorphic toxin-type HINT domain-containing protein [Caldilineaceae bacterium]